MVETEGPLMTSQYGAYVLNAGQTRLHAPTSMHTPTHLGNPSYASTLAHTRTHTQKNTYCFPLAAMINERASMLRTLSVLLKNNSSLYRHLCLYLYIIFSKCQQTHSKMHINPCLLRYTFVCLNSTSQCLL
jgi:hypothetical protein